MVLGESCTQSWTLSCRELSYHFVSKEFNISLHVGIVIHRGKVVNPVSTLAHQELFNGSNVIFVT